MYVFFLIFFILVSIFLIFFILLQPGKGFSNTDNVNTIHSIKGLSNFGKNNLLTNIIIILSSLFLVISIILCNINSKKIDVDFFLNNHKQNTTKHTNVTEKKSLHLDIPN